MASTVTADNSPHPGKSAPEAYFLRFGSLNVGVYATNGVAVTAAQFGLLELYHLDVGTSGGIVFEYDKTNKKIKAYRQKDPAAAGGADIALPEVANGVDLSASVARFFAIGA
jgi:hypothetical protein